MSDHLVLSIDRLIAASNTVPHFPGPFGEGTSVHSSGHSIEVWGAFSDDEDGRKQCRICHEEDDEQNLEAPCSCNGSMKLAHRECIARWCLEKLDNICEICRQPYEGHEAPIPPVMEASTEEVHNVANATVLAADQFFDRSYDECATAEGARTACIRASILIPIAFMMLKHAYETVDRNDHSFINVINIFCLHLVTALAPLYVLSWFMELWLRRRERLERARLTEQIAREAARGIEDSLREP